MKVGIVIVTFNRKHLLIKILNNLKEQTYKNIKLYIIDNCSLDKTKEELIVNKFISQNGIKVGKKNEEIYEDQKIKYIKLAENMGGAGGFNRGIKEAISEDNDYIWLMDDDILPEKNYLEIALNYMKKNENIGAIMGVRYEDDHPIFYAEAKEFNFKDCFKSGFKETFPTEDEIREKEAIKIKDFPFEGPVIKSEIIKKIGYPNENFFIIGDDTDYALRIGSVSDIYMLTSLKIKRLIPVNAAIKAFTWKEYYSYRNVFYLNKVYGLNYKVKYLRNIYILLRVIAAMLKNSILEKKIRPMRNISKLFEAYIDSVKNRLGKKYVPGDF